MAKFFGEIGYGHTEETAPGVHTLIVTEKKYYGDVQRNTKQNVEGDKVNSDLTVGVSISIIADAYANENFFAIRYVRWAGTLWTVANVDVQRPRLVLRLGGVYNGPKAASPGTP